MYVFVSACGKCYRGQKESKGGEGEEVYPYCSRVQLGGPQFVGVGFRYKLLKGPKDCEKSLQLKQPYNDS